MVGGAFGTNLSIRYFLLPFLPRPESTHVDRKLTETNRGHQLLRRMGETFDCLWVASKMWHTFLCLFSGWEGAGLGFQEQGIQEPIKGGEVRDKQDKYKVCPTVHWNTYIPYSRKICQGIKFLAVWWSRLKLPMFPAVQFYAFIHTILIEM